MKQIIWALDEAFAAMIAEESPGSQLGH